MKDIHITKIIIKKPYKTVWKWLSNPMTYSEIYPNWVSKIENIGDNYFQLKGTHNEDYKIQKITDENKGIIDLKIGKELSRTRLFLIDKDDTLVIHIGVRWEDMNNPILWFFYKRSVDKDFKNAKKIIEGSK